MDRSILNSPVVLQFKEILLKKLTGTLEVSGKTFKKLLFFEKGTLIYARSNVIQERLGEILFRSGKISKKEFWNIHKLMEGEKDKIGKVLVTKGILTKKDLFIGIQIQITLIAKSTFYLKNGTWNFEENRPEFPEDSKFSINLADIIISGMEAYKNIFFFKDIYLNHRVITLNPPEELWEIFTENIRKLYRKIEESNSKTGNELCGSEDSNDTCWKNLVALFLTGAIDLTEQSQKIENEQNIEAILNLYEKLKIESVDYYSLFDLKIDASVDEIKKRYFILAKNFHPDRVGDTSDPKIREKANFVFAEINRAYEILANPKKREEYTIKKFKKNSTADISQKNLKEKASILYRKARTLFNRKQYWETTALMEEAIKSVDDKGVYYLLLGLSQMNIESMKWSAEKNLSKASTLEPMNAEPLVALGKLFESENMTTRAKNFFTRAISIDPENKTALEHLKLLTESEKKGLKKKFFSKQ